MKVFVDWPSSFLSSSQVFLIQLVCNLLDEGKALFQDSDWEEAVKEFSEGLNVSQYASTEGIQIPEVLLESLYVNRATAYHNIVRRFCDTHTHAHALTHTHAHSF